VAILVKCNSSQIEADGDNIAVTLGAQRDLDLVEGDPVYVWTSEKPRPPEQPGRGLELRGRLVSWAYTSTDMRMTINVEERLGRDFGMDNLRYLAQRFYDRLKRYRHPRVWELDLDECQLLNGVFL
jgi:hypothetical protein